MYEPFFQLTERPFASAPRTARYFPGALIEDARKRLTQCIERSQGPGLLVGPAGTGKSLLCHVVADHFQQRLAIAHLSHTRLGSRRVLLQAILYELGMPYRGLDEGELRLSLIDRLSADDAPRDGMLLLVDEAQMLPLALLEEIRLISNLVRGGEPRVHVALVGNSVLDERFASPRMDSFNQRIAARCYLGPFDREETCRYVRAQIAASGGDADGIFSEDALQAIHSATDGVPRLINQVCDHALLLASAGGVRRIPAAGIDEAWADLQQLPVPCGAMQRGSAVEDASVIEFGSLSEDDQAVRSSRNDGGGEACCADLAAKPIGVLETCPGETGDGPADDAEIRDGETSDRLEEIGGAESAIEADVREETTDDSPDRPLAERGAACDPTAPPATAVPAGQSVAEQASGRVDAIERHLVVLSEDDEEEDVAEFKPAGSIGPQIELVIDAEPDPFSEPFEEEEVVIDQYGAYDMDLLGDRPRVDDGDGPAGLSRLVLDVLGGDDLVRPDHVSALRKEAPQAETAGQMARGEPVAVPCPNGAPTIDGKPVILVEDDPVDVRDVGGTVRPVKRQEYRQLFQRLRRG